MDKLQHLVKLLPLGALFIVSLSCIRQFIYYSLFGINISDFLQFQEYITLFIDDLLYYSVAFSVAVFLYLRDYLYPKTRKNSNSKSEKEKKSGLRTIIVVSTILFVVLAACVFFIDDMTFKLSFVELLATGLIFTLFMLSILKEWNVSYPAFIITLLMSKLVINSFYDAYKVFEGDNLFEYTFQMKEEDSYLKNVRYIGKSDEYLFLYNAINGETMVHKTENIEKIKIVRTK